MTARFVSRWVPFVVLLPVLASTLFGCDLVKSLGKKGDDDKATSNAGAGASAVTEGLPQECVDYLAIYKCVHVKSGEPNVDAQVNGLRDGFNALATNVGAAAAKKQCAELMASSQDGFAKVGCTKGVVATGPVSPSPLTPPARVAVPTAKAATAKPPAAASAAKKKDDCGCSAGQVQFTSADTVICAVLPCRSPGGSCKKEDKSEGTCMEIGTGEAGQRVRCGHLIQCL
ncbi:MAG TPA: hypothetical protein VLT33_11300 [Labilithrix sp.]|nr:hypothetical protein [Labilithrix sp.]